MALAVPFFFAAVGLNTPTSRLDVNFQTIATWINRRNPTVGALGTRPAPGNQGAIFIASDQANTIYVDTGLTWLAAGATAATLPGASFFDFDGIATPTTPAAGRGRLFTSSTAAGLRALDWLDAGGTESAFTRLYIAQAGNPIKDIVNTTTETSLWTSAPTIKGGTLGANRELYFLLLLDYFNNSGASRQLTVRVKYGGATFLTLQSAAASMVANATRFGLWAEIWLTALTTTVQFGRAHFNFRASDAGQIGVAGASHPLDGTTSSVGQATNNAGAIDSTVDQTLDITAQHDVANANLSVRPFLMYGQVLG